MFARMSLFIALTLLYIEPVLAGPGGSIVKAATHTFWGRVVLGLLVLFFLPLITYILLKEALAERRTRKDLRFMARHSVLFDWLNLQARVKDCFFRVHSSWQKEDLSTVSEWMTDWYWQNQQLVYLDKWQKEGLVNVCDVKKITAIKPLLFAHRNLGEAHEQSMIVVSISAKMCDFLKRRSDNTIVEGDAEYKEVETLWTFVLHQGAWKVFAIEDGSMSLGYAKMVKDLPRIETTLLSKNFT